MKATIYYKNEGVGSPLPASTYTKVWEGDVHPGPNARTSEVLEALFFRFNVGDRGGLRVRSLSVGDVVHFNGTYHLCDILGWTETEPVHV